MPVARPHPSAGVAAVVVVLALASLARTRSPGVEAATEPARAVRPAVPAAAEEPAAARALREGRAIDVNAATALELELLPRIGPALAARIIAHRDARGPFRSVEALSDVPGIGPRTLEQLRPFVSVGSESPD